MSFSLIENAEVYAPESRGRLAILIVGGGIAALRPSFDERVLSALETLQNAPVERIDASDCFAIPGLVDPHEHLTGGSGESGFASQTPAIRLDELVEGGITSVVGCIGVDTYLQNLPHLFGRVKALREEGISAFLYSGGYDVPPKTLTGDLRTDLLLVPEIIGAGEIAISDVRSTQPSAAELARVVAAARTGGLLTGKAGITHFHVGDDPRGLAPLRALLDEYGLPSECLYPTHVERQPSLLKEAAEITHRGVRVDMDTCEENLPKDLSDFVQYGGVLTRLTLSSDAAISAPKTLYAQIRECALERRWPFETLLALVTRNPAEVLKLRTKGRIREGGDADIVLIDRERFTIRDVFAGGRRMMKEGEVTVIPRFAESGSRFATSDRIDRH